MLGNTDLTRLIFGRLTLDSIPYHEPILVATFIAVLIGAQVLGITGVLVAIPVAGMVQVFVQEWLAHRRESRAPPTGRAPPDQVTESLPE